MPVEGIQIRIPEIGRLRIGAQRTDPKRPGAPLDTFRFTSRIQAELNKLFGIAQKVAVEGMSGIAGVTQPGEIKVSIRWERETAAIADEVQG